MNDKAQLGKIVYLFIALFVALILFGVVLPGVMNTVRTDYCDSYIKERDEARTNLDICYQELNSSFESYGKIIGNLTKEMDTCNEEKFSACGDLKKEYDDAIKIIPKFFLTSITTVSITVTVMFSFTLFILFKFKLFDKLFGIKIQLDKEESKNLSKWIKFWYGLLFVISIIIALVIALVIAIIIISQIFK